MIQRCCLYAKKNQKLKGNTFQFLVHCCIVNLPLSIRVRIANFLLGFMSSQCLPRPIRLDGLSGPNSGPSSSVGPAQVLNSVISSGPTQQLSSFVSASPAQPPCFFVIKCVKTCYKHASNMLKHGL